MLIMRGSLALSYFRLERLLSLINNVVPQVNSLAAEFVHFIEIERELTPAENGVLSNLLQYGNFSSSTTLPETVNHHNVIVVPKAGTVSSWSLKATELALLCGLRSVKKIERGIVYILSASEKLTWGDEQVIALVLHDVLTESVYFQFSDLQTYFSKKKPYSSVQIDILSKGRAVLLQANKTFNLGLTEPEIEYLQEVSLRLKRNLTDTECQAFAEVYAKQSCILKKYIHPKLKNTYQINSRGILSAYQEHAAVIEGGRSGLFFVQPETRRYQYYPEAIGLVVFSSVNQADRPVGIGKAIRKGMDIGKGAKPKGAFLGISILNLRIPGFLQPWENYHAIPEETPSALEVILLTSERLAQFNNEYGIPNLCGYFRTFEQMGMNVDEKRVLFGYLQPLVVTGGIGHIRPLQVRKSALQSGMSVIVMGTPSMFIDVKVNNGSPFHCFTLQREHPEMQRRCQEVINACINFGIESPIVYLKSVGTGGIGTTLLEILHQQSLGGQFECRFIPSVEAAFSPLELWFNETPGRYIILVAEKSRQTFQEIAKREGCPYSILGKITEEAEMKVFDSRAKHFAIDMPVSFFFGNASNDPKTIEKIENDIQPNARCDKYALRDLIYRVLRLPAVADKSCLITLCDRGASGLVARDQMVGPWQVPVADCAVTVRGFDSYQGEAMAIGERTPLAVENPTASARIAVAEAITNIVGANIGALSDIRMIANWQIAEESLAVEALQAMVHSIGSELCPALGITVVASQEAKSYPSKLLENEVKQTIVAPCSLVISAFAPVMDVRQSLTPMMLKEAETVLLFVDLANGLQRMGGSALWQTLNLIDVKTPDVEDPLILKAFFSTLRQLHVEGKILAYHDRSDGGLFVTLCEMAFATHIGLSLDLSELGTDLETILFNEELGAVIQIRSEYTESVLAEFYDGDVPNVYVIGSIDHTDKFSITFHNEVVFSEERVILQQVWSETSYHLQSLRDNPRCAKKQFELIQDREDPGLNEHLEFDPSLDITAAMINRGVRPLLAVLRDRGTHGHVEMAAAFDRAQFECVDVHMEDLEKGQLLLSEFKGLVVCPGFSYGDVLGAGLGWAKRILFNPSLKQEFENFFKRNDTFTLGVSNGCQVLSGLRLLIPGAALWPHFIQNYSEQFESRLCLVEVQQTESLFLKGMEGSRLIVPVAHREGRALFLSEKIEEEALKQELIALRYVDSRGRKTTTYPANPDGSSLGITGLTTADGRILIMMPHPERAFRSVQYSWHPNGWGENAPWLRLFRNARKWVG